PARARGSVEGAWREEVDRKRFPGDGEKRKSRNTRRHPSVETLAPAPAEDDERERRDGREERSKPGDPGERLGESPRARERREAVKEREVHRPQHDAGGNPERGRFRDRGTHWKASAGKP